MTAPALAKPRLGPTAVAVLESLNQHRLLSTSQIRSLHAPQASPRWIQYVLARLHQTGLAAAARAPRGLGLWYLTERGVDAAETIPSRAETRRKVIRPEHAAGPLQQHTLAVNEVGLAFVKAARVRGDDCGPFAWRHEIAHPLGPPPGRRTPEQLIADAVLTYQLTEPDRSKSMIYRFLELDRANRSTADLTQRLGRYARLYRHTIPADPQAALWTRLYPVFPAVLVVLAGRPSDRLEERRCTVLALCRQNPDLRDAPAVEVSLCLLEDLSKQGPFAAICRTTAAPDSPVDWLGQQAR